MRSRPSLAEQMAPSAAAMYLTCHEQGDALWDCALAVLGRPAGRTSAATSRWSPSDRYNLACYLAMSPPDELDEAVRHIRVAEHLPGFAGWHLTDPQLKTIADKRAWRMAFGAEPRKNLLAVAPFEKHREALEAAGLLTAEALARSSAADLSRLLDVDLLVASHLQTFAKVLTHMVRRTPTFGLELTCALQQRGLARLPISTSDGQRAVIATELRQRLSPSPRTSDVFRWLS